MDKPTEEQIKEFREWCGFTYGFSDDRTQGWFMPDKQPFGDHTKFPSELPPIDLNNLFKYAVPKILEKIGKVRLVELCNTALCDAIEAKEKVDMFLFWALSSIRNEEVEMAIEIRVGDYIRSDFASFVQGTVVASGTMGKGIPAYKIKTPIGKTEYILKGQAELLITPEEETRGQQIIARHD